MTEIAFRTSAGARSSTGRRQREYRAFAPFMSIYKLLGRLLVRAGAVVFATILLCPTFSSAQASMGDCLQPISAEESPTATDCLFILQAAVGLQTCTPHCVCDPNADAMVTSSDALLCLNFVVGTPSIEPDCPCGTTTTSLPGSQDCPVVLADTFLSTIGAECSTDEECPLGSCDGSLGRCRTVSDLDVGWTGIYHDVDIVDATLTPIDLRCGEQGASCGLCELLGVNPDTGVCRCANDSTQICDEPLADDADDCGGARCECYIGPPLPVSGGNTPICIVNRLGANITGTVNLDTGDRESAMHLRSSAYLGVALAEPCPYCEGDLTFNDGERDGRCVYGANAGGPCDAEARHESFPAPGGGAHSLDCLPDEGKNVTGQGLSVRWEPSTSVGALGSEVECGIRPFLPEQCPCGVCSDDQSVGCSSDDDCVAGTCGAISSLAPRAHACSGGESACIDTGDGNSVCASGPTDGFCDGLLRADGRGFIGCQADADCAADSVGLDAGSCTLASPRSCFEETIHAQGSADPLVAVVQSIFCVPPTSSDAINSVGGFPGPARVIDQFVSTAYCDAERTIEYVPGQGICP